MQQPGQALRVLPSQQDLRNPVYVPILRVDVAIQDVVLARCHKGQRCGFASYCGFDDRRRFQIFLKKIVPAGEDVAVHQ